MTMGNFLVDDGWHDHPKVLAAGNAAAGLWTRMGSYAARYLTNGFVPHSVAVRMGTPSQISRLLNVGLIDPDHDGYVVHDYLDANRTRAAVLAQREDWAQRQRKSRAATRAADNVSRSDSRDRDIAAAAAAELAMPAAAAAASRVTSDTHPANAAEALELYIAHRLRVEARNVRSPSKYADKVRRDELAQRGLELAGVDPDADPVDVCAAVFGISIGDATRARNARERDTNSNGDHS